jgi:hypothetical protein
MELTLISCILLSIGVTAFVYLDDQFAGLEHKKSRYTRLFVGVLIGLWVIIKQTSGGAADTMVQSPNIASQNYNVGISPF